MFHSIVLVRRQSTAYLCILRNRILSASCSPLLTQLQPLPVNAPATEINLKFRQLPLLSADASCYFCPSLKGFSCLPPGRRCIIAPRNPLLSLATTAATHCRSCRSMPVPLLPVDFVSCFHSFRSLPMLAMLPLPPLSSGTASSVAAAARWWCSRCSCPSSLPPASTLYHCS